MPVRIKPTGDEYTRWREEWKRLAGNPDARKELMRRYGSDSITTGKSWASEGDTAPQYNLQSEPAPAPEIPQVIALEPVKFRKFKSPKKGRGDPETQVIILGDHHAGEITPSYNPEIYRKRMDTLLDSLMTITYLHRNMYALNDLVILCVGDMVHGENPYQGATVEMVDRGAVRQVVEIALPCLKDFIMQARQEFKTVEFMGIRGNHGRYDRLAPRTSNWDLMLYGLLQQALSRQSGISIEYSNDFYAIKEIKGFRFFLFHGDQIPSHYGLPYYGIHRKLMTWHSQYNFPFAILGHFHQFANKEISTRLQYFMNGSMVTDDPWALEKIGLSSTPMQWTFGIHQKMGITFRYPLIVDHSFLPQSHDVDKEQ